VPVRGALPRPSDRGSEAPDAFLYRRRRSPPDPRIVQNACNSAFPSVLKWEKESPLPADDRPCDDDGGQGAWIARTVQPALAYAITLVRNRHDAEDIVQECYRKLLARATHYDLPRDGVKLLYKSITNACINHVQRRTSSTSLDNPNDAAFPRHAEAGQPADAQLIQKELEEAIRMALEELPVNQRAVLQLSSLGHSLVDAAEMLNVSHSNARVLLHRARQGVAERLQKFREGEAR